MEFWSNAWYSLITKIETGQFLSRFVRSPGVPEEIGAWDSQGGEKDKCFFFFFFFSTFLSISHIKLFVSLSLELMITQQTTQFKLCTRDYTTTMYPAWGQVQTFWLILISQNVYYGSGSGRVFLLQNSNTVILKCKLWE